MEDFEKQQVIQEEQYNYPYHYIPQIIENRFSQNQTLSWGYEYLSYLNFIIEKAIDIGFESLLDVGCGDGRLLFELRKKVKNKKLGGIDYSKRAIDYAKIMSPEIEWLLGNIRDKSIFKIQFDIITLIETLEHIPPDEINDFLKGLHNNLMNNGNLIITVPSKNIPLNKKHFQHFDINSLKTTLKPYFKVKDYYYLNNHFAFSLKIIKKILINRFFILNHQKLLSFIYNYYINNLLAANKNNCGRIAAICNKL